MSFTMPDLVIESVLREGFMAIKRRPELIDDIFGSLLKSHVSEKYGQKEIRRIKEMIAKKDWSFVHSFGEVEANLPCVSIQLGNESEAKGIAHLDDMDEEVTQDITDEDKLAALVIEDNILPDNLDYEAGIIYLPDSVNLSKVHVNHIYVDADDNEFVIIGGVVNEPGQKQVVVAARSEVNIMDVGRIKSSINYEQFAVRGVHNDVQLLLGVHTKDALTTKYIYILVKYILLAGKKKIIQRNLINMSYQGSDFTRNLKYEGDIVYTRFLTITGNVQDQWRSDKADIFDNVEVRVKVPKDLMTTEDLDKQDQTIQVGPTDQGD